MAMQEFWTPLLSAIFATGAAAATVMWLGKLLFERALATKLQLGSERISLLRHQDLEYKAAEIERLYGPLYALLKTQKRIYDLWMAGKLSGTNLKVKRLFKSRNDAANKIIVENANLIDEVLMPDC